LNNPVPRTYKRANPDAVRLLVFDLLTEVNRSDGYSNLLLPQALTASKFDDRDKPLQPNCSTERFVCKGGTIGYWRKFQIGLGIK
jgi:hypothetical protein